MIPEEERRLLEGPEVDVTILDDDAMEKDPAFAEKHRSFVLALASAALTCILDAYLGWAAQEPCLPALDSASGSCNDRNTNTGQRNQKKKCHSSLRGWKGVI